MFISRERYEAELKRRDDEIASLTARVGKLSNDLYLLCDHLGLELYTEPTVPEKRLVLTKKEAKKRRAGRPTLIMQSEIGRPGQSYADNLSRLISAVNPIWTSQIWTSQRT